MAQAASRVLVPVGTSLALHAALALGMLVFAVRPKPVPQTPLEIQVVDAPRATPPEPLAPPPPIPTPRKVARAPRKPQELPPTPTPLPPTNDPPPPTSEAPRNTPQAVVVTGITMESTSEGAGLARADRASASEREALQGGTVRPGRSGQRAASAAEPGGAQPAQVLSGAS